MKKHYLKIITFTLIYFIPIYQDGLCQVQIKGNGVVKKAFDMKWLLKDKQTPLSQNYVFNPKSQYFYLQKLDEKCILVADLNKNKLINKIDLSSIIKDDFTFSSIVLFKDTVHLLIVTIIKANNYGLKDYILVNDEGIKRFNDFPNYFEEIFSSYNYSTFIGPDSIIVYDLKNSNETIITKKNNFITNSKVIVPLIKDTLKFKWIFSLNDTTLTINSANGKFKKLHLQDYINYKQPLFPLFRNEFTIYLVGEKANALRVYSINQEKIDLIYKESVHFFADPKPFDSGFTWIDDLTLYMLQIANRN